MNKKLKSGLVLVQAIAIMTLVSSRLHADTGTCGGVTTTLPFTDVGSSIFFCQIAEAYFSGLTNGTSATTYSPSANVPREQMAAFITRTQDSALRRGSRRAALEQWATPAVLPMSGLMGWTGTAQVKSDGADLWVAGSTSNVVRRFRASDGKLLETWTGAYGAVGVLVARSRVYVTGADPFPVNLYVINPSMPAGAVTTLTTTLDIGAAGIATDGAFIWTANNSGSVSRVDPDSGTTTNIPTGFSQPVGILFDGANIWVADSGDAKLKKLDSSGNIAQSVAVGVNPQFPVFDGSNIWVPNFNGNSITVVRSRDGLVLATLTGNGLNGPEQAAFDGQRILVTNFNGDSVSLWKAADLTPIGVFSTGLFATKPFYACSDGINFWITLKDELARF